MVSYATHKTSRVIGLLQLIVSKQIELKWTSFFGDFLKKFEFKIQNASGHKQINMINSVCKQLFNRPQCVCDGIQLYREFLNK